MDTHQHNTRKMNNTTNVRMKQKGTSTEKLKKRSDTTNNNKHGKHITRKQPRYISKKRPRLSLRVPQLEKFETLGKVYDFLSTGRGVMLLTIHRFTLESHHTHVSFTMIYINSYLITIMSDIHHIYVELHKFMSLRQI